MNVVIIIDTLLYFNNVKKMQIFMINLDSLTNQKFALAVLLKLIHIAKEALVMELSLTHIFSMPQQYLQVKVQAHFAKN